MKTTKYLSKCEYMKVSSELTKTNNFIFNTKIIVIVLLGNDIGQLLNNI